jgi:hypothetical protein
MFEGRLRRLGTVCLRLERKIEELQPCRTDVITDRRVIISDKVSSAAEVNRANAQCGRIAKCFRAAQTTWLMTPRRHRVLHASPTTTAAPMADTAPY